MDKYEPNPMHRNGNPEKSQWTITIAEEKACWEDAVARGWHDEDNKYCWGLKYTVNQDTGVATLEKLGETAINNEESKIARFEHTSATPEVEVWHGYPLNYMHKQSDIPKEIVLKKWCEVKLIAKHTMIKIMQGRRCNL